MCNCLILICSIQHQMKVNLWTKMKWHTKFGHLNRSDMRTILNGSSL
ncbi:hypothetical protein ECTX1999_5071 [Escherichia coli TX1999]|nr:hypothetical protein ECTX1999_5071 [Escherichia coli TX1999]